MTPATTLETPVRDRYDLAVVGGGIYGAATAYEAARRGLGVVLIERDDFGQGASSNSLKIVHGGLRYLQDYDLRRVMGSHRELLRLLTIAPHRVRPLRCEIGLDSAGSLFRGRLAVGRLLHGWLARRVRAGLAEPAPRLPRAPFPGWYDGIVMDTEKLLLDYLHTAVAAGQGRTTVINHCAVDGYERQNGSVTAVRTSSLGRIAVGGVIECTGARGRGRPAGLAMNLIVDRLNLTPGEAALGLRHPGDGRYVFLVPWRGRTMIGTYERDYPHPSDEPVRLDGSWVDEFLAWLVPVHPELAGLGRGSIRFLHFGLLPRDASGSGPLSRTDRLEWTDDGRLRVTGVKYTTSRALAARAVERWLARRDGGKPPAPPARLRLVDRDRTVAAWDGGDEVRFAVEHERARTLSDVLLRRTGAATAGHPGPAVVSAASTTARSSLDWTEPERIDQVERFENELQLGKWLAG